jgi:hypothetical protein
MKKLTLFLLFLAGFVAAFTVNYSFAMQMRSNSEKFYCYGCRKKTENKISGYEKGYWYLVDNEESEIRGIFCEACHSKNCDDSDFYGDESLKFEFTKSEDYNYLRELLQAKILENINFTEE